MDQDIVLANISAIIPTATRSGALFETLKSLGQQHLQPAEIIIIDASQDEDTQNIARESFEGLRSTICYLKAEHAGAAVQRNQGISKACNPFILFMDDDIVFEKKCLELLWEVIQLDDRTGAVNAMITNQQYHQPGRLTRWMYRLMSGEKLQTYAGKCIGPAWNLLPEDNEQLPSAVQVEWLNTTCTIYRKEALPEPVFDVHFTGYSLMEDLALSLKTGKQWKLYNVRTARIFHDSQPGIHKSNVIELAKMELVNRYFIMTEILDKKALKYKIQLIIFQLFQIITSGNFFNLNTWKGKLKGLKQIAHPKK